MAALWQSDDSSGNLSIGNWQESREISYLQWYRVLGDISPFCNIEPCAVSGFSSMFSASKMEDHHSA